LPARNRNVWAAVFAATALLVAITLGATALSWFHARSGPPIQIASSTGSGANSGGALAPEPQPVAQPAPEIPSEPIVVNPTPAPPPASAPAAKTPAKKRPPASPAPVEAEPTPAEPAPQPEPPPPPPQPSAPAPKAAPSRVAAPAPKRLATLREVRSLFVATTDEGLDQYIHDEIQKQIPRLKLVESAAAADAVMNVTVSSASGGTVSRAERVLGFKNRSEVHAIVEQSGTTNILWQQGAGDHKPIIGAFHGTSLKTLAERIVKELAEEMR